MGCFGHIIHSRQFQHRKFSLRPSQENNSNVSVCVEFQERAVKFISHGGIEGAQLFWSVQYDLSNVIVTDVGKNIFASYCMLPSVSPANIY
jgi:hypothetical protein